VLIGYLQNCCTSEKETINLHVRTINMSEKAINRIKVILAEKRLTNKWLAVQLGKTESTVSRWCTNEKQPTIETFIEIAYVLDVDVKDLLVSTK
jgi:DNA-binding Xre family transcriptional regulator